LTAARFRTSVGDMSIRRGRGCSWAMCMERRLVATRSPQNLQRALPGEMWTRCIPNSMSGSLFARQAQSSSWVLVGKWLLKRASRSKSLRLDRYYHPRCAATAGHDHEAGLEEARELIRRLPQRRLIERDTNPRCVTRSASGYKSSRRVRDEYRFNIRGSQGGRSAQH